MAKIGDAGHLFIGQIAVYITFQAQRVESMQKMVSGWIWPFSLLAAPLGLIGGLLRDVSSKIWAWRGPYDEIVDAINNVFTSWGLSGLISNIFGEWDSFKRDPGDFISGKLDNIIPGFDILRRDPWEWLHKWLYNNYYDLWSFLADPLGSVDAWLKDTYPGMAAFLDDPLTGFRAWLLDKYPQAWSLLFDTELWIKAFLQIRLGVTWEFWVDPWGYLFSKLLDYIDLHIVTWARMLSKTGERVIRYIWEGQI